MIQLKSLGSGILLVGFALCPVLAGRTQISVTDAESGQAVAARAYLRCADKPVFPAGAPAYRRGAEEHILLSGKDTFDLPDSPCELVVVRGLEYQPARVAFTPKQGESIRIAVKRWVAMNKEGWYSADMHVHRNPQELPQILLAEDLNFAPTITYHVWSNDASQPYPNAPTFPVEVDATHIYTANSQEVERIQGGPGAVILMARQLPIPFEGYEFYPPSIRFTRAAHEMGGYVGGDKLIWLDTYVNVALGQLDFIEINCNHFLPHDVDTDLPPWSHWPVEMGYHGDREFAHWMMDFYYRILNCGFELPLSGGSASGVKATPVGYDRVYVYLGDRPFSYDNFMQALKAGKTFSTNGPLIDFKINGQVAPGSKTELKRGQAGRIEAVVRSDRELDGVQVIVNGKIWRSYDAAGRKELRLSEELKPDTSSWVAVRAFERAEQTVVFAHTSAAYLLLHGRPVRSKEDARLLVSKMDQLIQYTETKGVFRKPEEKAETLALYREARAIYQQRAAGR